MSNNNSLSRPQAEILAFYKDFMAKHNRAPSFGEASKKLNKETSNIHYHVKNLEKLGFLVRTGGYRDVRLVEKSSKLISLLGIVACGEPITILEEVDERIDVPSSMITEGYGHYALKAKGDSMINAGINDGDILVIRKQSDVNYGEIGVVATGEPPFEGATLKRVYHKKNQMLLMPANDDLEPYLVQRGEVRGKLVGVIRNL